MELTLSFPAVPQPPSLLSGRTVRWVALSVVLHGGVLFVLAHSGRLPLIPIDEPIRVTLVEVAAPPPPLGAPQAATGPAPQVAASVPVPEPVQPVSKPEPFKIPKKPQRPRAKEVPPAVQQPPAAVAAPSDHVGSPLGADGGVSGGVPGGQVGGTVGGQGDRVFRADQIASPPTLVAQTMPIYPPMARARGVEGLVVLESIIDRKGQVEPDSVKVVQSVPSLDDAAASALRQWRFRAGRDDHGEPVRVIVQVPIRFRLR